ncbi:efflux RND transporter periplasmic adaptor subunit [Ferrimonas futtsuensis]|uniref:efflux RND transporter periplasmic adaptor subunit n=1 Tax=Ferrimonas futtsuensis TaxID=364764 RepID=UPI000422D148|nr:efflux RND transporter periplasmic adaptor subunit [Ferrimonas futtsuensis]
MRIPRGAIGAVLLSLAAFASQGADYLVGEVKAYRQVVVSAQSEGVVESYRAEIGDRVEAGEPLVGLNPEDAELALAMAKAQLALSQAERDSQRRQLQRMSELAGKQSLAESELDEQQRKFSVSAAQVQVDRSLVAQAQMSFDKTRLTAPFAAHVGARFVEQGQWVSAGDPLFELVQMDRVKVQLVLIEQDSLSLSVGTPMRVFIPALARSVGARVSRISPSLTIDGKGYLAELDLDNAELSIQPGYRAEVYLDAVAAESGQ